MRHSLILLILPVLILAGCTSSSGGGGDTTTPSSTGEIGRRTVPGYDVIVSREAGAEAGKYRIDLVGAAPQQVEAWIACCGYDPDAPTIAAETIVGTANAWRVSFPTSGKLWVRITDAAGNLLEVGGDDFPVGP